MNVMKETCDEKEMLLQQEVLKYEQLKNKFKQEYGNDFIRNLIFID